MKTILGIAIIIASVILGVYLGIWVMLIGGIMEIVAGVTATPVSAHDIAFGIVRILFASFTGAITFYFGVFSGLAILSSK